MNRIYKVIYSTARQCAMVVSELAKSSRKGAGHAGTPALARMVAAVLAAGALTWGIAPGASWAADTAPGNGYGVAIGTDSNAPKTENVAIGKGATISYSNGASSATGDIVVGNGANINNYASQGGSIAIGKNAKVENMAGGGEASFAFGQTTYSGSQLSPSRIPADPAKVIGSIAIGDNTFARTGSTMIGSHNYTGDLGDTKVDSASTRTDALNVYATTIGANSFSNGAFTTSTGVYNIISSEYNGGRAANPVKNLGATINGALNSIESKRAASYYSGIANTVSGIANRTFNANGSLIYGAGNEITNSFTDLSGVPTDSGASAKEFAEKLRTTIKESESGGSALAIGGGNTIDRSIRSQVIGVNNKLTGNLYHKDGIYVSGIPIIPDINEYSAQYNMIDGYNNQVANVNHAYVIGANNIIQGKTFSDATKNGVLSKADRDKAKKDDNLIVIGDNHTLANDVSNDIILGTADKVLTTRVSNVVMIGHNADAQKEGGVALGANSVASVDTNVVGYDPSGIDHSGDTTGVWKSKAAAVSVGRAEEKDKAGNVTTPVITRQITNVAAGTQDTDAVNVAQLKAISNTVDASKMKYYSVQKIPFTETQLGSYAGYTNEANDGAKEMGALAAGYMTYAGGIASTVTGSLSGVINRAAAPGSQDFRGATALSYGTFNINNNSDKSGAFSGVANSIVGQANMTTDSNAALIYGAGNVISNSYRAIDITKLGAITGNLKDPKALGEALQAAVPTSGGQVMAFGGGNVVDNAYMTQVIGVGNTVKGNQTKNTDGTWSPNGTAEFKNDTSSQLNYVDGFYTTLINGKNDYLIGAHNMVTGDSVKNNHSNIVIGDNHTLENQSNNIILGSADSTLPTTASQVTIVGHNANATVDGGVAIGAGSVASREAGGEAGYDPANGDHQNDTTGTWKSTAAAVSVGDASKKMTRQITNVAAGKEDTDAVNVAQLKNALAGAKDGNDTLKSSKEALKLDGNKLSMNIQDTAGNTVSGSVDLSNFAQAVDTNTTYTFNSQENKDNNTTTITVKDSNGKESSVTVATKDTRNTVKAGENVTLDTKDNADGSLEYTVNVNADGKVKAGSTKIVSGDTVYNETRVKQDGTYVKESNTAGENLSALDNQVDQNTQSINYLNGRVGELGDRINKVGAGAAALAALHPLDFDPDDKWDFAAGVGNYRNATAAAVGLFYRPNERTMFNLGWTMGDNRNMVNGGFSVKFGKSNKYVKYSKAEMASVIDNQSREIAELKAKDAQNAKDNAEMRAEIEALKKQVEALAAKK